MTTMSPARRSGNEDLLDVDLEGVGVDRAVEDEGGDHAATGEAGDEGRGLPVTVRDACSQALAAAAAAVGAGHVGGRPGLVDEHQPLRIEVELAVEPGLAASHDVGTILLGRVPGLFLSVIR